MFLARGRSLQEWKSDGLPLSTTSEVVAQYTDKLFHSYFGIYDSEKKEETFNFMMNEIVNLDERNAIYHTVTAKHLGDKYCEINGTRDEEEVAACVRSIKGLVQDSTNNYTVYERMHLNGALEYLEGDDWSANKTWESILVKFPNDPLSASFQYISYLHAGRADKLHDLSVRSSVAMKSTPYHGSALSREAFALEELGQCKLASKVCEEALELTPWSTFAGHAHAHICETRASPEAGIAMYHAKPLAFEQSSHVYRDNLDIWTRHSPQFTCHQFWHYSLFLMAKASSSCLEEALNVYDEKISPSFTDVSDRFSLSDAVGFLFRMEMLLSGAGTSASFRREINSRWDQVGELIFAQQVSDLRAVTRFPFYDSIMVLAMCANLARSNRETTKLQTAMREAYFERVRENLAKLQEQPAGRVFRHWPKMTHLHLTEAILRASEAFCVDDFDTIIESLYPLRNELHSLGGSRAQTDVFHQLLFYGLTGTRRLEDLERMHYLCKKRDTLTDSESSYFTRYLQTNFLRA